MTGCSLNISSLLLLIFFLLFLVFSFKSIEIFVNLTYCTRNMPEVFFSLLFRKSSNEHKKQYHTTFYIMDCILCEYRYRQYRLYLYNFYKYRFFSDVIASNKTCQMINLQVRTNVREFEFSVLVHHKSPEVQSLLVLLLAIL